jgi:hypothetical protein
MSQQCGEPRALLGSHFGRAAFFTSLYGGFASL